MREVLGFVCVATLAVSSIACSEAADDGSDGQGGTGGAAGANTGMAFPCSEQGIRDAIAEGGGPHTFRCSGPEAIITREQIIIDNDVILDGEGNLIVDGNQHHRVFWVTAGVAATLRRVAITRGSAPIGGGVFNQGGTLTLSDGSLTGNLAEIAGAGIHNADGEITLNNTSVQANLGGQGSTGGGIYNGGTLNMNGCTVSENTASEGGGLDNDGTMSITNSTISGNMTGDATGGAVKNTGTVTISSSTISGNDSVSISGITGAVIIANTIIDGECAGAVDSRGYNIESPANTCSLDETGDATDIPGAALALGSLADNGGPTETHALEEGSVAVDAIPDAACELATDQRGEPRPETGGTKCDVGAFELQPAPQ